MAIPLVERWETINFECPTIGTLLHEALSKGVDLILAEQCQNKDSFGHECNLSNASQSSPIPVSNLKKKKAYKSQRISILFPQNGIQ